jgi:hypothetical protein
VILNFIGATLLILYFVGEFLLILCSTKTVPVKRNINRAQLLKLKINKTAQMKYIKNKNQ